MTNETLDMMDEIGLAKGNTLKALYRLFNNIYENGKISSDWLTSTFDAIPKKPNAKTCEDHRLMSLMSHELKAFLKILYKRMYQKCEEKSGVRQFGFKNGLGTINNTLGYAINNIADTIFRRAEEGTLYIAQ